MSPTTRATPRCAARSCGRIDLVPSRRLAIAWLLWLSACLGVLAGGVALPWPARAASGIVLIAANIPAIRVGVLLRGPRAVRTLEWGADGEFRLRLGADPQPWPATLSAASFRLGIAFLVLRFSTPAGRRLVLIDGARQDPVAFRRLSRHLGRAMLIPSRPKV
jgi:hypothetical protein